MSNMREINSVTVENTTSLKKVAKVYMDGVEMYVICLGPRQRSCANVPDVKMNKLTLLVETTKSTTMEWL